MRAIIQTTFFSAAMYLTPIAFKGSSHVFFLRWEPWYLILLAVILQYKQGTIEWKRIDRSTDKYSTLLIVVSSTFLQLVAVAMWDLSFLNTTYVISGVLIGITGLLFRLYAMNVLGKDFSQSIQTGKKFCIQQSGPYKYIRHPTYLGALGCILGTPIVLNSWMSLWMMGPLVILCYGYRIKVEENQLLKEQGAEYALYQLRTWRLIPYVW